MTTGSFAASNGVIVHHSDDDMFWVEDVDGTLPLVTGGSLSRSHLAALAEFSLLGGASLTVEPGALEVTAEWGVRYLNMHEEPVYISTRDSDPEASCRLAKHEGDVIVRRYVTPWVPTNTEATP